MRASSVSPEVSVEESRVSDTVITAMRTGTKARVSSMREGGIADEGVGGGIRLLGLLRQRRGGRKRRKRRAMRPVVRPIAGGGLVQRRGGLAHALAVHPVVSHEPLHIGASLRRRHALDEQQRIVESMPSPETRSNVKRLMTYYW